MATFMKENGKTITRMDLAKLNIKMVIFMKATGNLAKLMAKELIFILMGLNLLEK
jgi:hypothetical protein